MQKYCELFEYYAWNILLSGLCSPMPSWKANGRDKTTAGTFVSTVVLSLPFQKNRTVFRCPVGKERSLKSTGYPRGRATLWQADSQRCWKRNKSKSTCCRCTLFFVPLLQTVSRYTSRSRSQSPTRTRIKRKMKKKLSVPWRFFLSKQTLPFAIFMILSSMHKVKTLLTL